MQTGLPWNHNNHYHDFLLAQLHPPLRRALDIGCGLGEFAGRLAQVSGSVDAIDSNAAALEQARVLQAGHPQIHFMLGDFIETDFPQASYDLVSSLASLHHMDFGAGLEKMRRLLAPGGMLLVLGLYREATLLDYAVSAAALPANLLYRLAWEQRDNRPVVTAPVKDPGETLDQIRTQAHKIVPGARIRRHLLWRYSLVWQKPAEV